MALNGRQRRFCDEYMANGGNAYKAALKAGFAESTARDANDWVRYNPDMISYIAKHSGEMDRHNDAIATAEEVQEFATSVMRGEKCEVVVASSGKTAQVPANLKDRLRSADMLAKMKGMYTDNHNINTDMDLHITVEYGDEDGSQDSGESDI